MSKFTKIIFTTLLSFAILAVFPVKEAKAVLDCGEGQQNIVNVYSADGSNPNTLVANSPLKIVDPYEDICIGSDEDLGVEVEIVLRSKVFQNTLEETSATTTITQLEEGVFMGIDEVIIPGPPEAGPYDVILRASNGLGGINEFILAEISVDPEVSRCGYEPPEGQNCPEVCLETENRLGQAYCGCGNEDQPPCVTDNYSGFVGCVENYVVNESNRCQHENVNSEPNVVEITKCPDDTEGLNTALGCFKFDSPINFIISAYGFLLGLSGAIALILIAFSAFQIMISSGDPRSLQGAKDLLISSISGLLMVILAAYLLRVIGVDILGIF